MTDARQAPIPDALHDEIQAALGATYQLERELGGGGMSKVFLATEIALGRQVVIKIVAPELLEGASADRFTREVQLAARLQQANIVPLLSAGTARGIPYYVMPFIRGESLRARMSRGDMPPSQGIGILRDVARALEYAHGEGVMHRDIKPDNILLSGSTAVVTDFGIAKALSATRAAATDATQIVGTDLTRAGMSIGTPAYMAPEQGLGDPDTDHRADLYAWGVVAWELLGGEHPFAGCKTVHSQIAAHVTDPPPSLAERRPDLPAPVSALVMRCLEKQPADRPANATDLLEALDAASTGAPLRAATASRIRLLPRSRVTRIAVAVFVVLSLGAVAVAILRRGPVSFFAGSEKSLVVLPFVSQGGDTANTYFAEGMADEVSTALAKVPGLKLAGRNTANALQERHATVQEIGKSLGVGAVLQGSVRRIGESMRVSAELTNASSGIVMWSDKFERQVKDVFALQDDIAREIVGALRMTLVGGAPATASAARGTTNLAAYDDYLRGLHEYSKRGARIPKAVEHFSAAIAEDSSFARAWAGLALALAAQTIYANVNANEVLPRAMQAAERATKLDPSLADAYMAMGVINAYSNRWAPAEDAYRRAIALDSTLVLARMHYGRLLFAVGRAEESLRQLERGQALDPLNANMAATLSSGLITAGRNDEALVAGQRAFEIDSTVSAAKNMYMVGLVRAEKSQEALALADRLLRYAGPDVGFKGQLAYAIASAGDLVRARRMTEELANGPPDSRLDVALVRAYLGTRDTAKALDAMERLVVSGKPFAITAFLADPMYDAVRGSARFAAVVQRLGLNVAKFTAPNGGRPR